MSNTGARASITDAAGKALVRLLFCLPFAIFALWVWRYAANVPYTDDFAAILGFLNGDIQTATLPGKVEALLSQHVEHRIVLVRLTALVQYSLRGQVDFRMLIFFGCIGWLLAVLVLSLYVKRRHNWPLAYIVPIPWVLLSFTTHENMFWAMGSIQNYWVLLFALLCLICLAERKAAWAACLFPLALFTSGAGALLYPIGGLFLLAQRKLKPLLLFGLPSTLFLLLYFYQYRRVDAGGAPDSLSSALVWLLAFLGNAAGYLPLAVAAGAVGLAGLCIVLLRPGGDTLARLLAGFILLAAAVTTQGRSGLGLGHAMNRHYAMYSLLTWVLLYGYALTEWRWRPVVAHVVRLAQIAAVLFFLAVLVRYECTDYFEGTRAERVASMAAYADGDTSELLTPNKAKGAAILDQSERLGVYNSRSAAR